MTRPGINISHFAAKINQKRKGGVPLDDKCIIDPQRDCIGKAEAAKLEGRIQALESWQKDSKDFHSKFYDWQREQIARDARLDEKLNGMDKNIKEVLETQKACSLKPVKRWDAIVDKAIWAVLAAVIAFVLAKFGL